MSGIRYPYIPAGRRIEYAGDDNPWMMIARLYAKDESKDPFMPVGAVIASASDHVIACGANESAYHRVHGCERIKAGAPVGTAYETCEGCSHRHHAEMVAIEHALAAGKRDMLDGATMYVWGYWWCCKDCWDRMTELGITRVVLLTGSEKLFNRSHEDNVVGHPFDEADF
ncbi:MAG: Cytidine and deoxycytidylate deaminase zinc-binding region [Candidatus Parcubacteria bacterium]|jgi:deoxycytidylate deaminase